LGAEKNKLHKECKKSKLAHTGGVATAYTGCASIAASVQRSFSRRECVDASWGAATGFHLRQTQKFDTLRPS
jgi:hypothetical protein